MTKLILDNYERIARHFTGPWNVWAELITLIQYVVETELKTHSQVRRDSLFPIYLRTLYTT